MRDGVPIAAALLGALFGQAEPLRSVSLGLALLLLAIVRRGLFPAGPVTPWQWALAGVSGATGLASVLRPLPLFVGPALFTAGLALAIAERSRRDDEDASGQVWDLLPIGAALLGGLFERCLHLGVEHGVLALLTVALVSAFLRKTLGEGRTSIYHVALSVAMSVVGVSACVIYPVELQLSVCLLFFAVVVNVGVGACARREGHLEPADWLRLSAIVGLNLLLRWGETMEEAPMSFLDIGPVVERHGWSALLLPVDITEGSYRWSTTGLVLVGLLYSLVGTSTFFLLNATLVLVSFWTSWTAFRSRVFSTTLALCFALGTQYHYVYYHSSCLILYLVSTYVLINLLCIWQLATGHATRGWKAAFLISLLALALCWEMWLDYAAFLLASLTIAWWVRPPGQTGSYPPVRFMAVSALAILIIYVPCKIALGGAAEHLRPGQESEVVLSYFSGRPVSAALVLAGEDVLGNALTFNYVALTTYLPPSLVSSSALRLDEAVILKDLYVNRDDPSLAPRLVLDNYVYLWRYAAGVVTFLLYRGLFLGIRDLSRQPTREVAVLVALLLLVALGSATHLTIKFRYYNAVPLLSYKCVVAVTGATLLLTWGVLRLQTLLTAPRFRDALIGVWLVIGYGALARPVLLEELCEVVGLGGARGMPNPITSLAALVAIQH